MVHRRRIRSRLAVALLLVLPQAGCHKRDGENFDIPEGNASETFLEFARQAEVEILFDPEVAEGIKTHAVTGHMSQIKALQVMIEDTGFYIYKDPMSDAIAIRMDSSNDANLKTYSNP